MSIRKPVQLLLIALITVFTAVLILLDVNIPLVRAVVTMFLILAVGHTTLLAWANHLALRGVVHVLMTIMLGITLVIVSGFILNFTAWGLETRTWVFCISAIILFNSVVALFRKPSAAAQVPSTSVQTWKLELNFGQFILLILTVVVTGASILIARNGALNQSNPEFSQLWMLADTTSNTSQAVLGIKNERQQYVTYRLVVRQGTTVIQEFPSISLAPNETWRGTVNLKAVTSTASPVEALLYRGDEQTEPYRSVNLWLQ